MRRGDDNLGRLQRVTPVGYLGLCSREETIVLMLTSDCIFHASPRTISHSGCIACRFWVPNLGQRWCNRCCAIQIDKYSKRERGAYCIWHSELLHLNIIKWQRLNDIHIFLGVMETRYSVFLISKNF